MFRALRKLWGAERLPADREQRRYQARANDYEDRYPTKAAKAKSDEALATRYRELAKESLASGDLAEAQRCESLAKQYEAMVFEYYEAFALHCVRVSEDSKAEAGRLQTDLRPRALTTESVQRFWELAAQAIPPTARRESFEPSYEDLKREHALARRKYTGKWQRRWLMFCFNYHAFRLITGSIRVWSWAKMLVLLKGLESLIPW